MPKLTSSYLVSFALLWALAAASHAQHKPRPAEEIARDYNANVQTITDEIDAMRKKLGDTGLSLDGASRVLEQQSALRKKADDLWNSSQAAVDASFKQTRDSVVKYNDDNRRLDFESAVIGSKIDQLNNVAKYPTLAEFEKNKEQMSQAWEKTYGPRLKPFGEGFAEKKELMFKMAKEDYGLDLKAEGYDRIGTYNPYTGDVFYKYYDKDGKILYLQWNQDAEGWRKYQEYGETYRRRQLEQKQQLEKESAALGKLDAELKSGRQSLARQMSGLGDQARQVNFSGTWGGTDSDGDAIQLTLNMDGTMLYVERVGGRTYRHAGTWEQGGKLITMRSNDGAMKWRGSVRGDFRLEINGSNTDGKRWTDYLTR